MEVSDAPDLTMFTQSELRGSDNDYLMREAEADTSARKYQQYVAFQTALQIGLSAAEAELVSGITPTEYATWRRSGEYLHNIMQVESDSDFHNAVNLEPISAGSEIKKSLIGTFGLLKAGPDKKKYQGGKRTESVQVTRNGKTFMQKRTVGTDKQALPKKKGATKSGSENELDKNHPASVKMGILKKVSQILGKIGKALKEKAKAAYEAAKDPETIKKVGDKVNQNVDKTLSGDGTAAVEGDVNQATQAGIDAKKRKEMEDKRNAEKAEKGTGGKKKLPVKKKKPAGSDGNAPTKKKLPEKKKPTESNKSTEKKKLPVKKKDAGNGK